MNDSISNTLIIVVVLFVATVIALAIVYGPRILIRAIRKRRMEREYSNTILGTERKLRFHASGLSNYDFDILEGHDFEYWCADLLQYCGFVDVRVTPGSGDQGVDILAKRDGKTFAIQCKRYNSNLGNKPIQEVNTGRAIYGCDYAAVMTNRFFTAGAVQAARAVGVLLWNRDSIQQMLDQKRRAIFQKSKEYKHQQRIEKRRNKARAKAQINNPSFFYCYNCGTKLIEGTKFCSTCGKPQ